MSFMSVVSKSESTLNLGKHYWGEYKAKQNHTIKINAFFAFLYHLLEVKEQLQSCMPTSKDRMLSTRNNFYNYFV